MGINYQGSGGGVPRKTAKIFAKDASQNDMTVFGSTLANNTVYSNDLDSIQSNHYEVGWREAVISNLNYPLLSDMNAVQHTLSQQIAYLLQHGIPEWDVSTTYYTYDIVQNGGKLFISLVDNNIGNSLGTASKWAIFYDPDSFLNKKQITNCIVEMPSSGEIRLWQGYIAVPSGIKLLIPAGLNSSDKTLSNINMTTTAGTYHYPDTAPCDCYLFVDSNNTLFGWALWYTFVVKSRSFLANETGDNQLRLAYIENENQWVKTENGGSTWTNMSICCLCAFHGENQTITNMLPENAVHIITDSKADIQKMTRLAFPTPITTFPLALGATDVVYTAKACGYIQFSALAGGADSFIYLQSIQSDNSAGVMTSSHASVANQFMLVNIPVYKGQKFQLSYYNIQPTNYTFGIVGALGEDNT